MLIRDQVLSLLPPYRDEWQVVRNSQYVPDIIDEILYCQRLFADHYDRISFLFLDETVPGIADRLWNFCKRNISYKEETDKRQTTRIPGGIIKDGYGDCKAYAQICGGVLGSLNRVYGLGLKWCFYFAGYKGADEPHHVFVSVDNGDEEIWIDPTPGAADDMPTLLIKKIVP